jgi:hypothetical protein
MILLDDFLVIVLVFLGHQSFEVDIRLTAVHHVQASLLCSSDCLDVLLSCLLELSEQLFIYNTEEKEHFGCPEKLVFDDFCAKSL